MAEIIAFVSGKGGMGKTALCAGAAFALAADGMAVLCVDCDDGFGDLDHYLAMGDSPALTYPEICRGAYPLEQAAEHPAFRKLRFLAAPAKEEFVTQEAFSAFLLKAKQQFDYILLDNPRHFVTAAQWVLVTKADPAAIRGARRKADALEILGARKVGLVVNETDPKMMAACKLNVDDVMDAVGEPLLGLVPADSNVWLAPTEEKILQTRTKKGAAAAIQRISRRLQGLHVKIPNRL